MRDEFELEPLQPTTTMTDNRDLQFGTKLDDKQLDHVESKHDVALEQEERLHVTEEQVRLGWAGLTAEPRAPAQDGQAHPRHAHDRVFYAGARQDQCVACTMPPLERG
jgi:hypothetical protein